MARSRSTPETAVAWRFADVVGHARTREALLRAVRAGQVAHAYLFSGIEGIGKEPVARALAAALNCEAAAADGDACGTCGSCRKIAAGLHPDVLVVEPDGAFIKVEQVREIERLSRFRPNEGRARVVLMRQADRLWPNAANALLKTLEEPSGVTHFILLTEQERVVLPTVRSRCQRVALAPLAPDEVVAIVRRAGLSDDQASVAAALGQGSAGRALAAVDADVSATRRRTVEAVETAAREKLLQRTFDTAEGFKTTTGESGKREEVARRLEALLTFYRDVLVAQVGPSGGATPVNGDLVGLVDSRAATLSPAGALAAGKAVAVAVDAVRHGANIQLSVERMIFEIRAAAGAIR